VQIGVSIGDDVDHHDRHLLLKITGTDRERPAVGLAVLVGRTHQFDRRRSCGPPIRSKTRTSTTSKSEKSTRGEHRPWRRPGDNRRASGLILDH
jgi:hypothetical protein